MLAEAIGIFSGAGPSVFGWFEDVSGAHAAAAAMAAAFAEAGLRSDVLVGPIDGPAAGVLA